MVNTALFVGIGVNVKLFLAFLLSGFFMRRLVGKALLVVFMLPWAVPALPAFLSIHWMLNGYGASSTACSGPVRHRRPDWLNACWLAFGANIVAYIWKWMPFWTVIFLAGRMAIPQELYEAAEVDGASGMRRFSM